MQVCASYVRLENTQTIELNVMTFHQVTILQTASIQMQKKDAVRLHHVHMGLLVVKLANPNVKDVRLV